MPHTHAEVNNSTFQHSGGKVHGTHAAELEEGEEKKEKKEDKEKEEEDEEEEEEDEEEAAEEEEEDEEEAAAEERTDWKCEYASSTEEKEGLKGDREMAVAAVNARQSARE